MVRPRFGGASCYAPRETRTPTGHTAHKALNFGASVSLLPRRVVGPNQSAALDGLDAFHEAFVIAGVSALPAGL